MNQWFSKKGVQLDKMNQRFSKKGIDLGQMNQWFSNQDLNSDKYKIYFKWSWGYVEPFIVLNQ